MQTKTFIRSVPFLAATLMSPTVNAVAQQVRFDQVLTGLDQPSMLTTPPGDDRLFICERELGVVHVYDQGALLPAPYIDLSTRISTGFERGLLGLAFHPDYASNGFMFVSYNDAAGATVVARYTVSAANQNVVDVATEQIVFGPLLQTNPIHNGGCVQFGPDGKLYLGLGDDGNHRNGQDLSVAYGKLLRFDVDIPFPHVPQDNPFVGQPNVEELVWAYGLRNPWRFSFDLATGDMWIGDVGTNRMEEVNFVAAGSTGGQNFGWSCLEGTQCTNMFNTGCSCTDPTITAPVHERPSHSVGCAIIGGHLYRGQEVPSLAGRYVFTDWCGGAVTSFAWDGLSASDLVVDHGITPSSVQATSISEGPGGELYLTDMLAGRVYKLVQECASSQYCSANSNSTGLPGQVSFSGTGSVVDNNFTLVASDLPPGAIGYYVAAQAEGFIANPGGSQGNFCLGGPAISRFAALAGVADSMGQYAVPIDLTAFPTSPPRTILPGETWKFQLWHRDLNPTVTSNFTSGLSVTFCP